MAITSLLNPYKVVPSRECLHERFSLVLLEQSRGLHRGHPPSVAHDGNTWAANCLSFLVRSAALELSILTTSQLLSKARSVNAAMKSLAVKADSEMGFYFTTRHLRRGCCIISLRFLMIFGFRVVFLSDKFVTFLNRVVILLTPTVIK